MVGKAVKKKLYDAASQGDVARFKEVVEEDPYLVDGVSFPFSRNLLHIATMRGQAGIVEEVLNISPQLARNLDSQSLSPLHIAAAQGQFEIAKKLLSVAPDMCWSRDGQGMNPIHIAAMNGHVEVLEELLRLNSLPAMERLHYHRQTVMHLCVKHGQLRALKALVEKLGELVDEEDDDGETILHLAVRCKQVEMIKYLVENTSINKKSQNSKKKTAADILEQIPLDPTTGSEIRKIMMRERISLLKLPVGPSRETNNAIMVVAVLIATMAFQAAVSPPGGVRQNADDDGAGEAVMASTHPLVYRFFLLANTLAFVSSLITILMVIPGMPSRNFFLGFLVLFTIMMSLVSIVVSYGASLIVITPNLDLRFLHRVGAMAIVVAVILLGLLFFCIFLLNLDTWKTMRRLPRGDSTPESLLQYLSRAPPERNFVASCMFIYVFQLWDRCRRRRRARSSSMGT